MPRLAVLLLAFLLAACEAGTGPYVEITGGGFIFNYRIAEAFYGIVATARRPVPPGTRMIVEFENPAGGPPLTVERTVREGQSRFAFDSPPVAGVVEGRDYRVVLRLETPDGMVIETHEKTYRSNVDQSLMPDKPLTVGPGYTRNPAAPR